VTAKAVIGMLYLCATGAEPGTRKYDARDIKAAMKKLGTARDMRGELLWLNWPNLRDFASEAETERKAGIKKLVHDPRDGQGIPVYARLMIDGVALACAMDPRKREEGQAKQVAAWAMMIREGISSMSQVPESLHGAVQAATGASR
jgi:hypothetical protein